MLSQDNVPHITQHFLQHKFCVTIVMTHTDNDPGITQRSNIIICCNRPFYDVVLITGRV